MTEGWREPCLELPLLAAVKQPFLFLLTSFKHFDEHNLSTELFRAGPGMVYGH